MEVGPHWIHVYIHLLESTPVPLASRSIKFSSKVINLKCLLFQKKENRNLGMQYQQLERLELVLHSTHTGLYPVINLVRPSLNLRTNHLV